MSLYDEPVLPVSETSGYMPGSATRADHYDTVAGSQSVKPEREAETGLSAPEADVAYHPGVSVESDPWDSPTGSQATEPENDVPELPNVPEEIQFYQDPDDPQFALITGTRPLNGANTGVTALPPSMFDTEGNDFVIVPQ